MRLLPTLILSLCLACTNERNVQEEEKIDWRNHWEKPKERDSILSMQWVHPRIKEYLSDTAVVMLTSSFLSDTSRSITLKNLGDINGDRINDSIMVVPELISADGGLEAGKSIIFTDSSIPSIKVDQVCLDVNFVFLVADIDEDGQLELGKYYTSCASRFKRLDLFSLKDNQWASYGAVTFDVFFEDPPMEERIKKVGKGKFKMRELTEEEGVKIDRWIEFEIK